MAVALSNLSARWAASASAVNTAIKMKVTDTTSAANSKLIEFTVNDVSKFAVEKSGNTFAESLTVNYIQANSINVINSTVVNEIEINVVTNVITANAVVTSNVLLAGLNTFTYIVASRDHANASFAQANTARTHANNAFNAANNAITDFSPAFAQANTARTHANAAHLTANAAFAQANTARTQANTALTTGQAAFAEANTSGLTLLGTMTFNNTSNTSSLSGLTLTSYKQISVVFESVDPGVVGTPGMVSIGNSFADKVSFIPAATSTAFSGMAQIDLNSGIYFSVTTVSGVGIAGDSAITTSSTTLHVSSNGSALVSGSMRFYGVA